MNALGRAHRRLLHAAIALLLASGLAWETWPDPVVMKAHGAAAIAALVLIGALLPVHTPAGWASACNRVSGAALLALCLLLAVTGWLLYYAGSENLRALASAAHLWTGVLLPVALGAHLWSMIARGRTQPSGGGSQ